MTQPPTGPGPFEPQPEPGPADAPLYDQPPAGWQSPAAAVGYPAPPADAPASPGYPGYGMVPPPAPGYPGYPPAPAAGYGQQMNVPTYLAQAILVTLFCCMPFGIVSIVFASQVSSRLSIGDVHGAIAASKKAKMWSWIGFACGGVVIALWILLLVATRNNATSGPVYLNGAPGSR